MLLFLPPQLMRVEPVQTQLLFSRKHFATLLLCCLWKEFRFVCCKHEVLVVKCLFNWFVTMDSFDIFFRCKLHTLDLVDQHFQTKKIRTSNNYRNIFGFLELEFIGFNDCSLLDAHPLLISFLLRNLSITKGYAKINWQPIKAWTPFIAVY